MLLMLPLLDFRGGFDGALAKRMLNYSYPILILGIAGILNQVADKIIFRHVYPDAAEAKVQLGIYGAASKIAMIMAMITQAFRYAYEPFVFGHSKDKNSKKMYADAMKYFVIFTLLAFLCVVFYLDILKYILAPDYWEGLKVVPIVMMAEIFMGIYFNLSFWYKLIDQTKWGAIFSFIGCAVLIALNVLLVPVYGYMACAWAGVAGYGVAMLLSYFVGQKKYPIDYDLKSIGLYFLVTFALYAVSEWLPLDNTWLRLAANTVLLAFFLVFIIKKEKFNLAKFRRR
jgi:O-antigen/teichoic acid export membrane protein